MLPSDSSPWIIAVFFLALTSIIRLLWRASEYKARSQGLPLPPGPPALPIVGHLLEIPGGKELPWETYREYSRRYGKLFSLAAMGRRLMIIDDPQIAIELFAKRSALYSSRAPSVITESCGWDWVLGFLPYGHKWRSRRRMFWQHFHPGVISRYYPVQENAARGLLARVSLSSPEKLVDDIRHSLGEVFIRAAYGLESSETNDKYIALIEDAMTSMDLMVAPGTNTLDLFPLLSRLPTWLPGTALLRRMKHYRTLTSQIRELPWIDSKEAVSTGKVSPSSMATALVEKLCHQQKDKEEEDIVKDVLAVAYAAGIDTTFVSLCAFFVAMSLFPDVQRKAQAELDAVIGDSRLPGLADREKLPYVNAVLKELQRWHVVTPLGVPHVNVEDDQYEGYFIPKNSLVMVNAWSMLHDEEVYPEPERFDPERYLEDGKPCSHLRDPATIAFGFGRRICPGRYFAETTLFIYIASVLHTLNITPPVDENGRPIQIDVRPSNDLVSRLEDCRCTVRPRSVVAESLIRGASKSIPKTM